MAWPQATDYNEAVQNPRTCFCDAELQAAEASVNALGLPMPRSGNFADVYQMRHLTGQKSWAVKCFTREVPGLEHRYAAISHHLQQKKLPFMVDFRFLNEGVRIRGLWFPLVKMRWIEGLTLNEFVRDCLDRPQLLTNLAQIWLRLAKELRDAGIAHGDLQHGNVLLVASSQGTSLAVKLVDYDGMYVPALMKHRSGEVGHPNYQHPERIREGTYGYEVDRFSHLVIYAALRALSLGGKSVWSRYDTGDNLLFRDRDFQFPETSPLFKDLWNMGDTQLQELAGQLILATKLPVDRVPLLNELVGSTGVKPLTPVQRKQVQSLVDQNIPVGELIGASSNTVDNTTPWWNQSPAHTPGGSTAGTQSPVAKQSTAPAPDAGRLKQRLDKKRKSRRLRRRPTLSNLAVALILGAVAIVGVGALVGFGYYLFNLGDGGAGSIHLANHDPNQTSPSQRVQPEDRIIPPEPSKPIRAPGLIAELYPNRDLSGKAHVRIDEVIDFPWQKGSPAPGMIGADNFSIRWRGWLRVSQPGQYKIITESEDGARLMLDGDWKIQGWNTQQRTVETRSIEIELAEGDHELVIEYFAAFQNAEIHLKWQGPGFSESPIPNAALVHDPEQHTQIAAANADYQPPSDLAGPAPGLPQPGTNNPRAPNLPNGPPGARTPPGVIRGPGSASPPPGRPPNPSRQDF